MKTKQLSLLFLIGLICCSPFAISAHAQEFGKTVNFQDEDPFPSGDDLPFADDQEQDDPFPSGDDSPFEEDGAFEQDEQMPFEEDSPFPSGEDTPFEQDDTFPSEE